ncbi:MAG: DUF192 domain-containing protein [Candidatus Dormibacteraeota bacterium]|nr:DUF192 domain-containing protein [Candidatus Dormibacteraeota bacterium]MBO0762658.1 DUF192 domain-containing protein [Candidatus Dormibacteraeota bacterium]
MHAPSGSVLASRLFEPRTPLGRAVGLLARSGLPPGTGMWLHPCRSIHTVGMRFSIDAVFVDRRGVVVRVDPWVRPGRMVPFVRRARGVVELPAGAAAGLTVGDELRFVPGD